MNKLIFNMTDLCCAHILVKHTFALIYKQLKEITNSGSRNPHSWREKNITRTKDEAMKKLKILREQITSGQKDFRKTAMIESDCGSSTNGGLLNGKTDQFQKPFSDAYLKLQIGEVSDIVETDSGVHIILRLPLGTL